MGLTEALCYYNTWFINQCSYAGVFVLMALESMIAPIPSELVMPFAGFLIFTGHFDPLAVMVASSLGSMVGSLLSYGMGLLGEPVVLRYGRYLFLNPITWNGPKSSLTGTAAKPSSLPGSSRWCAISSPSPRAWPACP